MKIDLLDALLAFGLSGIFIGAGLAIVVIMLNNIGG